MSNLKRIGSFLARNSFRVLSCLAVVGMAWIYCLDKEAAAFLIKGLVGILAAIWFALKLAEVAAMRKETYIPETEDRWIGKGGKSIPGTLMHLHPLDILEMNKEEKEEAIRRGWIEVEPEVPSATAEWEKID